MVSESSAQVEARDEYHTMDLNVAVEATDERIVTWEAVASP